MEDVVANILDEYALRAVPFLFPVAPVDRDVFYYRFDWHMMTGIRGFFTHEDYFLTLQPLSYRIYDQYRDAHVLTTRDLNDDISTYPSMRHVIKIGAPVPSGFSVIPLFILRTYEGFFRLNGAPIKTFQGVLSRRIASEGSI